jgi:predicted O-methyltransferase YrrM
MDNLAIIQRLSEDQPLFHYVEESTVQRVAAAGAVIQSGPASMAVTPGVLTWMATHLHKDMVTLETGAGYSTIALAATVRHHYCCTWGSDEVERIREYMSKVNIPDDKVTFIVGPSDDTLPKLQPAVKLDFAYVDGCHGYPFPALDWYYINKHLRVGGIVGMDNAELRTVREHCEFLEENGTYRKIGQVLEGAFAWFYEKLADQPFEWVDQPYARAKRDSSAWTIRNRVKRKASRLIKPYLY